MLANRGTDLDTLGERQTAPALLLLSGKSIAQRPQQKSLSAKPSCTNQQNQSMVGTALRSHP